MNWGEFKKEVDRHLEQAGIENGDEIEIGIIELAGLFCDPVDIQVNISTKGQKKWMNIGPGHESI